MVASCRWAALQEDGSGTEHPSLKRCESLKNTGSRGCKASIKGYEPDVADLVMQHKLAIRSIYSKWHIIKRWLPIASILGLLATLSITKVASGTVTPTPPEISRSGSQTPSVVSPSIKLSRLSLSGIPQQNETLGSLRAPVKMLYFNDPQCPFCLEWQTRVLPRLVSRYVKTGKLQIRWHGYAVLGPESVAGEKFIAAAGLQNHLWDVLDDVMANQGKERSGWLTRSLLEQVGAAIPGFDVTTAMAEAGSPGVAKEIAADMRQGTRDHLEGVPFIQVGRRRGSMKTLNSANTLLVYERSINHLLHARRR